MDMRYTQVFAISAVMAAALIFAAREAGAQDRPVGGVPRNHIPSTNHFSWEGGHGNMHGRFHDGFGGGVWIAEREVPVYIETPPPPAAAPLPEQAQGGAKEAPPREAYVIGKTYASLPGSCMKLIEEGVSFYYCGGEWYRQVGEGRAAMYRAVARKL